MYSRLNSLIEKPSRKTLIGILALAFLVRIVAIFLVGDTQLDHEYATFIPNLLNGRGFSYYSVTQSGEVTVEYMADPKLVMPTAFKPPIYSLLVAGFALLFGVGRTGIFIIEVLQSLVGVYTCWLIYDIARNKFNHRVAFWALLIAGAYPLMAFSSAQISDLALQVFLRVAFYWLLFKLAEQPNSKKWVLLTGVTMGVLLIARTEMLLYAPFVMVWMIWVFKDKWLRLFAPVALIAALTVAPWLIRNYIQFNVITLNTSGGLNLWEGQNEQAVGIPSWYAEPSAELSPSAQARVEALTPAKDYEVKLDEIYMSEAKEFMRSHPDQVAILALKKFVFYWGAVYPGVTFYYTNIDSPFYWAPWFLLLPFFIWGLILNRKSFREHFLFHTSFALSALTVMVFFVLPKYIVFVIPWVFVFAASAFSQLFDRLTKRFAGSEAAG